MLLELYPTLDLSCQQAVQHISIWKFEATLSNLSTTIRLAWPDTLSDRMRMTPWTLVLQQWLALGSHQGALLDLIDAFWISAWGSLINRVCLVKQLWRHSKRQSSLRPVSSNGKFDQGRGALPALILTSPATTCSTHEGDPQPLLTDDRFSDANETRPRPSWTSLKTKKGTNFKRLPLACTECRRLKIKCSGEQPACTRCFKFEDRCTYLPRQT